MYVCVGKREIERERERERERKKEPMGETESNNSFCNFCAKRTGT